MVRLVLGEKSRSNAITERERCVFEAGIKLAAALHQFVGVPVSPASRASLEKAIEGSIKNQPYVEKAKAKITIEKLNKYGYATLEGNMLELIVTVRYGDFRCVGRMKNIKDYPLMYVEGIEKV